MRRELWKPWLGIGQMGQHYTRNYNNNHYCDQLVVLVYCIAMTIIVTITIIIISSSSSSSSSIILNYNCSYTRSPLEDSRLFGPSPWKILRQYL